MVVIMALLGSTTANRCVALAPSSSPFNLFSSIKQANICPLMPSINQTSNPVNDKLMVVEVMFYDDKYI